MARIHVVIPWKREKRIGDGFVQLPFAAALEIAAAYTQAEQRIAGKQDALLCEQVANAARRVARRMQHLHRKARRIQHFAALEQHVRMAGRNLHPREDGKARALAVKRLLIRFVDADLRAKFLLQLRHREDMVEMAMRQQDMRGRDAVFGHRVPHECGVRWVDDKAFARARAKHDIGVDLKRPRNEGNGLHVQNKAWTKEETVCFGIILIFLSGILAISVYKHKILKQQAVAILLLAIYLGIVLGSTVFTRESSIRSYKLMPLWSWKEIIFGNDARELLIENLLNVILLLPMGALLPFVFGKKLKIKKAFLYGFFVSVVIECCQLVFKCGLFEWDDMIHNGIGCMLGDMIGNTILNEWQRLKGNRNI